MREDTEKSVAFNHNKAGFLGLLVTLGIVFGDIGTSPLYVMKAILHTGETINENTILGALSCIIWTLTLQTTIKYVCVALRADNNGEGGILALVARRMTCHALYLAIKHHQSLFGNGWLHIGRFAHQCEVNGWKHRKHSLNAMTFSLTVFVSSRGGSCGR